MAEYELEKWVWTEQDFERMGWHDSRIYALAFSPETFELLLDIDYLFEWVQPGPGEKSFTFWVAPATLVFQNVYDVDFDLQMATDLDILDVTRKQPRLPRNAAYIGQNTEWLWTLDCLQGEIKMWSVGYTQYIRTDPKLNKSQKLGFSERGGYSFARGVGV